MDNQEAVISKEARLAFMELVNMTSVPMSLNAVVRLNVADSIWQNGSNTPLTASEILTRILPSGCGDPENLQRILRLLTSYGVFNEHIHALERRYSLTDVGKTLVTDGNGLSYGSYVLQHHQQELMKAWPAVHEAVLDSSTEPFVKANGGETAYAMYEKRPEMNELMRKAMSGLSAHFMKPILESYDGFNGVERLVDVGGSAGDSLRMILEKHSHIKEGVNFDLPEVVAKAPKLHGVTHVGGDMLKFIPKGDAIFMKWMLVIFTDDEVRQIMINCFKAIPDGGKLIACEPVLPCHTDDTSCTRALLGADIYVMTMYRAKGKHRTEDEFRELGKLAGFTSFRAIYFDYFTLIEFKK
ncbi:nicotinate N-methyltransferase 1-like [Bidens hawaiensis]|uniref:nicotinate N-methyltransferase 1-like n=1 Tax=Bidens hawaiensis TaxID=980011 RepID=UPI00404B8314